MGRIKIKFVAKRPHRKTLFSVYDKVFKRWFGPFQTKAMADTFAERACCRSWFYRGMEGWADAPYSGPVEGPEGKPPFKA